MKSFRKKVDKLKAEWGKTPLALVTGGSSGMGLRYAERLAEAGCDLLLVSNQEKELQETSDDLKSKYNVNVMWRYQNLATDDAAADLYNYCKENNMEVDILISNAGMFFFKELMAEDEPRMTLMNTLHVMTPTKLMILFGNDMKQRGHGFMLSVASMAAKLPCPGITTYSATKAYLRSFGKSLSYEMKPYGVGMTTVCPAAIATPLYGLKPNLMKFGVNIGIIGTPEWLVKRALNGMFRKKRIVAPGFMNIYLPPLIAILPDWLENILWKKFK